MTETGAAQGSGSAFLSDAASPARLRVDMWNRIREAVERLAGGRAGPQEGRIKMEALFRRLEACRLCSPGSARPVAEADQPIAAITYDF